MDRVEEDLKRIKIIGWRVKAEDRQEWSRIVEQTKTHPGLYSRKKKKNQTWGTVHYFSSSMTHSHVAHAPDIQTSVLLPT
jgi:hypothetical protein